ncbi:hypothetical protein PPL_10163 [Heterostelium album PN500]|uniref:Uncharacterized protein n=1 Tax=Heterostelium pallidum (strain ATCC 26659 / Pp 5 / PN500) TaxID=670386 RepID=D3BQH8_HETP5|nr:hypothetical protein PPL_10163 [Heterostelium album PN500]EFA76398.1 hypothetical protein PPL_10163 [Heterostelium album PN500]|eukprot:XP_020428530.1 hypothetical protein PPL_10163 [Heterostelium album PN500]
MSKKLFFSLFLLVFISVCFAEEQAASPQYGPSDKNDQELANILKILLNLQNIAAQSQQGEREKVDKLLGVFGGGGLLSGLLGGFLGGGYGGNYYSDYIGGPWNYFSAGNGLPYNSYAPTGYPGNFPFLPNTIPPGWGYGYYGGIPGYSGGGVFPGRPTGNNNPQTSSAGVSSGQLDPNSGTGVPGYTGGGIYLGKQTTGQ